MDTTPAGPDTTGDSPRKSHWLFVALLLALLLVASRFAKWNAPPPVLDHQQAKTPWTQPPWTLSPKPTGETVSLEIDFGNGAKKTWADLPWRADMTVADVLAAARDFRPGLEFGQIGSGESGFLSSLDGLANEGVGGRNWIYEVDGHHAHVSFCVEKIEPGMRVLWRFTDEQYNGDEKE